MPELHKVRNALTCLAVGAVGAWSIHAVLGAESDYAGSAQLPRCFDGPTPGVIIPETPTVPIDTNASPEQRQTAEAANKRKRLAFYQRLRIRGGMGQELAITLHNGRSDQDPAQYPEADDAVAGIVELDTNKMSGSGVISEDSAHRQVIITAAHVVGLAKLNHLKITTNTGESTHVRSGCYEYDDEGKQESFKKDDDGKIYDTDVAVLYPDKPLKGTTLRLRDSDTQRGEWAHFVNFQRGHQPGSPAIYTALAATASSSMLGFSFITGLRQMQQPVTYGDVFDNYIQPGASGGAILGEGNVIDGISVGGLVNGKYLGPEGLKSSFNISISGAHFGAEGGFIPTSADAMPASLIRKAIAAAEQKSSQK